MDFYKDIPLTGSGGGGIASINGDTTAAQLILGGAGITVSSPVPGTTVIAAGGGVWTPAALGFQVVFDFDSSIGVTQSGGAVSSVLSNDMNKITFSQASGAAQPGYTTNALNGYPSIDFNGTSSCLVSDLNPPADYASFGYALYIVARHNGFLASPSYETFLSGDTNGQGNVYNYLLSNDPTYELFSMGHDTSTARSGAMTLDTTNFHTVLYQRIGPDSIETPSEYTFGIDATRATGQSCGAYGNTTVTNLIIGAGANGAASFANVSIVRMILLRQPLSTVNDALLRAYFFNRYGI